MFFVWQWWKSFRCSTNSVNCGLTWILKGNINRFKLQKRPVGMIQNLSTFLTSENEPRANSKRVQCKGKYLKILEYWMEFFRNISFAAMLSLINKLKNNMQSTKVIFNSISWQLAFDLNAKLSSVVVVKLVNVNWYIEVSNFAVDAMVWRAFISTYSYPNKIEEYFIKKCWFANLIFTIKIYIYFSAPFLSLLLVLLTQTRGSSDRRT